MHKIYEPMKIEIENRNSDERVEIPVTIIETEE